MRYYWNKAIYIDVDYQSNHVYSFHHKEKRPRYLTPPLLILQGEIMVPHTPALQGAVFRRCPLEDPVDLSWGPVCIAQSALPKSTKHSVLLRSLIQHSLPLKMLGIASTPMSDVGQGRCISQRTSLGTRMGIPS